MVAVVDADENEKSLKSLQCFLLDNEVLLLIEKCNLIFAEKLRIKAESTK